jgi:hypothetical protein
MGGAPEAGQSIYIGPVASHGAGNTERPERSADSIKWCEESGELGLSEFVEVVVISSRGTRIKMSSGRPALTAAGSRLEAPYDVNFATVPLDRIASMTFSLITLPVGKLPLGLAGRALPRSGVPSPVFSLWAPETLSFEISVEKWWELLNERRLRLIDKDIDEGLSDAERTELDELEKKAEDYLNRVAPLPFEMIEKLKACAAKDGLRVDLD